MISSLWKNVKTRFANKVLVDSAVGKIPESHYRVFLCRINLWYLCSPGGISKDTVEFYHTLAKLTTPHEARAARDFFQMLLDEPFPFPDGNKTRQECLDELEERLTEIRRSSDEN